MPRGQANEQASKQTRHKRTKRMQNGISRIAEWLGSYCPFLEGVGVAYGVAWRGVASRRMWLIRTETALAPVPSRVQYVPQEKNRREGTAVRRRAEAQMKRGEFTKNMRR